MAAAATVGSVGIVGGGISGAGVLHQLVQKLSSDENVSRRIKSIHFWEYNEFGPGIAWSSMNSDVQIFNLPAGVASLVLGDYSAPFLKWCGANSKGGPGLNFGSYPPRSLFGEYAAEFIQTTVVQAKDLGIEIFLHGNCNVVDIMTLADAKLQISWQSREGDPSCLPSTQTIVEGAFLCTGPASVESEVCFDLRGHKGYFASPWPHPVVPHTPDATVAIIGTGLTAVDAIKQLYANGYQGSVIMASRQGKLPTVKGATADPFRPLKIATPEAVRALVAEKGIGSVGLLAAYFQLIKDEMCGFDEDFHRELHQQIEKDNVGKEKGDQLESTFDPAECNRKFRECYDAAMSPTAETDAISSLRAGIAHHKTGQRVPWQDCIIALSIRDVVRFMWYTLGDEEKLSFQSRYTTIMQIYFNSMPVSSAEDILSYLTERGCSVRSGLERVTVLTPSSVADGHDGGANEVSLFQLDFSDGSSTKVNHVINATGFGKHINDNTKEMMTPLHRNICRSGLVSPSPYGGLSCDFSTCRLHASKEDEAIDSPRLLYGVGHIISGAKFMTSGLSYCLGDGAAAVADFIENLKKTSSQTV